MEAAFLTLTDAAAEMHVTITELRRMIDRTGGVRIETRGSVAGLYSFDVAALAEAEAERAAALVAHEQEDAP